MYEKHSKKKRVPRFLLIQFDLFFLQALFFKFNKKK
jgi:hypothetical protein